MATVGGNLFSPPRGGDVATALLALDARGRGRPAPSGHAHRSRSQTFFTGLMTTALAPDELVTAIVVPPAPGRASFLKLGRRDANTPAVVTVAARLDHDGGR